MLVANLNFFCFGHIKIVAFLIYSNASEIFAFFNLDCRQSHFFYTSDSSVHTAASFFTQVEQEH